jgi:thiamine transport system substrate-binding protein
MLNINVKLLFLVGILISNIAAAKTELTIYTYDSFASEWGPGPKIKEAFEKECDCTVNFVGLDSSIGILGRLQIEAASSTADIALGLDTNLMETAAKTGLFDDHNINLDGKLALPATRLSPWNDKNFVPFDWGYFAFVYDQDKLATPPASMAALLDAPNDLRIVIQDPRTATPGLGLLLWMNAIYPDNTANAWKKLAPKITTVTKGWWDAYSMFLEGEADMVLSYSTSPAYHAIAEGKTNFKAARFAEGHYTQIEVAGILKAAPNKTLARRFLTFLISDEAQSILPTTNWMYPAGNVAVPDAFATLIKPGTAFLFSPKTVADKRADWTNLWRDGLSQ